MKVIVTVDFIDKYTDALHPVGEELTISKSRYEEILQVGPYVRPADEPKRKTGGKKTDGHGDS